jgi:hypothetical protein
VKSIDILVVIELVDASFGLKEGELVETEENVIILQK